VPADARAAYAERLTVALGDLVELTPSLADLPPAAALAWSRVVSLRIPAPGLTPAEAERVRLATMRPACS
jgi:hypothetical protein